MFHWRLLTYPFFFFFVKLFFRTFWFCIPFYFLIFFPVRNQSINQIQVKHASHRFFFFLDSLEINIVSIHMWNQVSHVTRYPLDNPDFTFWTSAVIFQALPTTEHHWCCNAMLEVQPIQGSSSLYHITLLNASQEKPSKKSWTLVLQM